MRLVAVILAVTVVVSFFAAYLWAYWFRRRRFRNRGAPPLSEWLEVHYANEAVRREVVQPLLKVFGDEIGIEPTKLLPSDRLREELGLPKIVTYIDDWSTEHVGTALTHLVSTGASSGRRVDKLCVAFSTWTTLDDVIRGVHAILEGE